MSEPEQNRKLIGRDLPLTRLLPNMLTILSLCAGLTGMRFALLERWQDAMLAIVIAAVFDVLDGRVARLLNIASKFGAELDSLSDVVSFGVAPGIIIYVWALKDAGGLGWVAVLVYAACVALRLARFNTMLEDISLPIWAKRYFTGVPSPAGAGLALLPFCLFLEYGDSVVPPKFLIAIWLMISGGLMVSRLPTLALKGWRVGQIWVAPIFLGMVLAIAALITNPWLVLSGFIILYLLSLPVGWYSYRARMRKEEVADDKAG
jgi:CDP-diacylglycerol--serine O-phosphatidyltransferase